MGQYHRFLALDDHSRAVTLSHYALGCGAKLAEQAWPHSPYIAAIGLLATHPHGPFTGRRLVVVGDYADAGDPTGGLSAPWDLYGTDATDVTADAVGLLGEAAGWTFPESIPGSPWRDCQAPDDFEARVARWRVAPGDHVLAAARCDFGVEYMLPGNRAGSR